MIVEPLQVIVQTAFPGAKLAPGFSSDEIAAAERRLTLTLPEALQDYFTVGGHSREMMDADAHILAPDKLRVESDHLIFCEENQGIASYGIPLAELRELAKAPNPSVAAKAVNQPKWFSESSSLSAFLLGLGAWQALLSEPEKARCELPQKQLKTLRAFFEPVGTPEVRLGGDRIGLVDRKNSIVAAYLYNSETLYVGSPLEDALDELEKRSGLELESL